jgi:hypothetical protein
MLTTHHEENRRQRAEQRRGDIDAERLGGFFRLMPGPLRSGLMSQLGQTEKHSA